MFITINKKLAACELIIATYYLFARPSPLSSTATTSSSSSTTATTAARAGCHWSTASSIWANTLSRRHRRRRRRRCYSSSISPCGSVEVSPVRIWASRPATTSCDRDHVLLQRSTQQRQQQQDCRCCCCYRRKVVPRGRKRAVHHRRSDERRRVKVIFLKYLFIV